MMLVLGKEMKGEPGKGGGGKKEDGVLEKEETSDDDSTNDLGH
jgi:hypothetical protein